MLYDIVKYMLDPVYPILAAMTIGSILSFRGSKSVFNKRPVSIVLSIMTLITFFMSTTTGMKLMFYPLERDFIKPLYYSASPPEAIVVLVGGTRSDPSNGCLSISHETPSRLFCGIRMFHRYRAKRLVLCGGGVPPESEIMAQAAIETGIDPKVLILEKRSLNTMQHARYLSSIITVRSERIGLVTHAYHMRRSLHEFRRYFSDVVPLPSEFISDGIFLNTVFDIMPSMFCLDKSTVALREMIGNLWYFLRY